MAQARKNLVIVESPAKAKTVANILGNGYEVRASIGHVRDRPVGYKISPLLWNKVRRGLSAGRVQSVALRMAVDREHEIEEFNAREYWTVEAELAKRTGQTDGFRSRLAGYVDKKRELELG